MPDQSDQSKGDYFAKAAAADKEAASANSIQDAEAWRRIANTCRFITDQQKAMKRHGARTR